MKKDTMKQPDMMMKRLIRENLENGDLARLVTNELHIDEYKSKMGEDEDICVISFKVKGKEPANDMMAFLEKGYDFILDSDVSSGEIGTDGNYLIFVELDRTEKLPEQIWKILSDSENLTGDSMDHWTIKYRKDNSKYPASEETLKKLIPLTPQEYKARYDKETTELDQLKTAAGVDVTTKAPVNDLTDSLRVAAGIK